MRKLIFFLLTIAPLLLPAQKNSVFTIKGKLKNIKDIIQWVFLSYSVNSTNIIDSTEVKNNFYSFTGKLTDPVRGTLIATYQSSDPKFNKTVPERDRIQFFLETGKIKIISADSFANATIKAGKANTEFTKLQKQVELYNDKIKQLMGKYEVAEKDNDSLAINKLDAEMDAIDSTKVEDVYGAYVRKYADSPIALYALQMYAGYAMKADKVEPVFNILSAAVRTSEAGKTFAGKIETAKKTAIGMMAMDFTQPDTSGNMVKLSSFKGKYVLLNFWASWCPHCKKNNPSLVTVFNKYKDKPFNIVSVGIERPGQKEKWLHEIHDAHLTWIHISDLKMWDDAAAKLYGITAIPQNFLIDPDGRIIARNLMKDKLDQKLAEIFTKKSN